MREYRSNGDEIMAAFSTVY